MWDYLLKEILKKATSLQYKLLSPRLLFVSYFLHAIFGRESEIRAFKNKHFNL
ncbi:hypothetical protein X924_08835 [Petrotoga sp. 9PWA.NaAc.5.4]|nr:hypothetical protein X924_08835 [Petrotoga sp. 9PWA.NaAc.5.4]